MKYDIYNPTKAARVIYDGIPRDNGQPKNYHFPAGSKREGIELSDDIAKELMQRTKGEGNHDADLRLTPHRELEKAATAPPVSGKK